MNALLYSMTSDFKYCEPHSITDPLMLVLNGAMGAFGGGWYAYEFLDIRSPKTIKQYDETERAFVEAHRAEVAQEREQIEQQNLEIQKENEIIKQQIDEAVARENEKIDELNKSRGYWEIETIPRDWFYYVIK